MRRGEPHTAVTARAALLICALTLLLVPATAHARGQRAAPKIKQLCSAPMEGASLSGDLQVPAGQNCSLVDSTISGSVIVHPGGTLHAQGSTITGNLVATSASVSVAADGVGHGSLVEGALQLQGGGPLTLLASQVDGDVQIRNEPAGPGVNELCASTVGGNLRVHGNAIETIVGDAIGCGGNQVAGNLRIRNNNVAAGPAALVSNNTVGKNIRCFNNQHPAIVQTGSNAVTGRVWGECAAPASVTQCSGGESACNSSYEAPDNTAALNVSTNSPGAGEEQVVISFSSAPIGCTTAATGDVATFYVTNPGPGPKFIEYESLGAAADAAQAAHPITEGGLGYVCYESPNPFTTADGTPAQPGPTGFYGQLPACVKVPAEEAEEPEEPEEPEEGEEPEEPEEPEEGEDGDEGGDGHHHKHHKHHGPHYPAAINALGAGAGEIENPPCVLESFFGPRYGEAGEDAYFTELVVPESDPRASH